MRLLQRVRPAFGRAVLRPCPRCLSSNPASTTHFGYSQVPVEDKTAKVKDVFYEVAERYDIMNDLMSAGLHRCPPPRLPAPTPSGPHSAGPRPAHR